MSDLRSKKNKSCILKKEEKHLLQMELEQTLISKKSTGNIFSVDRDYVNSKAYHDKFEQLPVNHAVQQMLYQEAGRLLEFVDGQEEERLSIVNARTGEHIVDNFARTGSVQNTGLTKEEAKKAIKCKDSLIVLHNHSLNGRPSAQDMLTYLKEKQVKLSLILCHDGTIYSIYEVNPEFKPLYYEYLENAKEKTNDIDEAKRWATSQMYILNDKYGMRHKLFQIRKL